MTGSELIAAERERQTEIEGFTNQKDDSYIGGELCDAAVSYCSAHHPSSRLPAEWPWAIVWWKPKDRIRNLVRAGALIAAEIDRLQRLQARMKARR